MTTLKGKIYDWTVNGETRRFSSMVIPLKDATSLFSADVYVATKNTGEQRNIKESHARKLKRATLLNDFTPTPISVGLRAKHKSKLEITDHHFTLNIEDGETLPLTDGNHRLDGWAEILDDIEETLAQTEDAKVRRLARPLLTKVPVEAFTSMSVEEIRDSLRNLQVEIENLPINTTLHLDGDTKTDFINLQLGLQPDTTHMLSLSVMKHSARKDVGIAWHVAKKLNSNNDSSFSGQIKFDSRQKPKVKDSLTVHRMLPVNTLCAKGASDICASLVGLVNVCKNIGNEAEVTNFAEQTVVNVERSLRDHCQLSQKLGKVLTPPPDGTKGSATMIVGVATITAAYMVITGGKEYTKEVEKVITEAVNRYLNVDIRGSFTSSEKRKLLYNFAAAVFNDVDTEKFDHVPTTLLNTLSYSTFGLQKPKKAKGETPSLAQAS